MKPRVTVVVDGGIVTDVVIDHIHPDDIEVFVRDLDVAEDDLGDASLVEDDEFSTRMAIGDPAFERNDSACPAASSRNPQRLIKFTDGQIIALERLRTVTTDTMVDRVIDIFTALTMLGDIVPVGARGLYVTPFRNENATVPWFRFQPLVANRRVLFGSLPDVDRESDASPIDYVIETTDTGILIGFEGYGEGPVEAGYGRPVLIEKQADQIRVHVWDDINDEEPRTINMCEAKEAARQSDVDELEAGSD